MKIDIVKPFASIDMLLLTAMVVWGLNYGLAKIALSEMNPLVFNLLRLMFSSLTLLALALVTERRSWPDRRTGVSLLLIGLMANGGQVLSIIGLQRTMAMIAALIFALSPIWITVFGEVSGIERISFRGWLGVFSSFFGIILMMDLESLAKVSFSSTLIGELMLMMGSVCWALYTILSRSFHHSIAPMQFVAYTMTLSFPFVAFVSIPSLFSQDFRTITWVGWMALAFCSIIANGFGNAIWYLSVRKLGSTRTGVYQNLIPLVTIIFSWKFLGETLLQRQIVGAILVFVSIFLVRSSKQRNSSRQ